MSNITAQATYASTTVSKQISLPDSVPQGHDPYIKVQSDGYMPLTDILDTNMSMRVSFNQVPYVAVDEMGQYFTLGMNGTETIFGRTFLYNNQKAISADIIVLNYSLWGEYTNYSIETSTTVTSDVSYSISVVTYYCNSIVSGIEEDIGQIRAVDTNGNFILSYYEPYRRITSTIQGNRFPPIPFYSAANSMVPFTITHTNYTEIGTVDINLTQSNTFTKNNLSMIVMSLTGSSYDHMTSFEGRNIITELKTNIVSHAFTEGELPCMYGAEMTSSIREGEINDYYQTVLYGFYLGNCKNYSLFTTTSGYYNTQIPYSSYEFENGYCFEAMQSERVEHWYDNSSSLVSSQSTTTTFYTVDNENFKYFRLPLTTYTGSSSYDNNVYTRTIAVGIDSSYFSSPADLCMSMTIDATGSYLSDCTYLKRIDIDRLFTTMLTTHIHLIPRVSISMHEEISETLYNEKEQPYYLCSTNTIRKTTSTTGYLNSYSSNNSVNPNIYTFTISFGDHFKQTSHQSIIRSWVNPEMRDNITTTTLTEITISSIQNTSSKAIVFYQQASDSWISTYSHSDTDGYTTSVTESTRDYGAISNSWEYTETDNYRTLISCRHYWALVTSKYIWNGNPDNIYIIRTSRSSTNFSEIIISR